MPTQKQLENWAVWINQICLELENVAGFRQRVRQIQEIVNGNSDIQEGNDLLVYLVDGYSTFAFLTIRRQTDSDKKSISLMRLFEKMQNATPAPTLRQFIDQWDSDSLYSTSIPNQLKSFCELSREIEHDKAELISSCKGVKDYVDRRLAHTDRRIQHPVQPKEVDSAIDWLCETAGKYRLLITGNFQISFEPSESYDWRRCLRVPWVNED